MPKIGLLGIQLQRSAEQLLGATALPQATLNRCQTADGKRLLRIPLQQLLAACLRGDKLALLIQLQHLLQQALQRDHRLVALALYRALTAGLTKPCQTNDQLLFNEN